MTELKLDPYPYVNGYGWHMITSLANYYKLHAPNATVQFAPRPEYSQNEEDYL